MTGAIDVRSTRIDMANLLSPFNSADHVKKHEPVFADIAAFLLTVQPPKYPFPVDGTKAARGQVLFAEHCQKCHGTKESYPTRSSPWTRSAPTQSCARARQRSSPTISTRAGWPRKSARTEVDSVDGEHRLSGTAS